MWRTFNLDFILDGFKNVNFSSPCSESIAKFRSDFDKDELWAQMSKLSKNCRRLNWNRF